MLQLIFVIFIERKLDLKIITAGNSEYTSVQLFSDEDGSPTGRVLIAIIVSRCSVVTLLLLNSALTYKVHSISHNILPF